MAGEMHLVRVLSVSCRGRLFAARTALPHRRLCRLTTVTMCEAVIDLARP
jgi:hypothetical protein